MPVAKLDNAPRCRHIKLNGEPCRCPAIGGQQFCHFHKAVETTQFDATIPFVEDATSLQLALMQIIRALSTRGMDYRSASLMLYALQIACTNLKRFVAEQPSAEDERRAEDESLARILLRQLDQENPEAGAFIRGQLAAEHTGAMPSDLCSGEQL